MVIITAATVDMNEPAGWISIAMGE
jgi:hypothetical protein